MNCPYGGISGALHPAFFEKPGKDEFFSGLLINKRFGNQNKMNQSGKRGGLNKGAYWVMNKPKTFWGSDLCRK